MSDSLDIDAFYAVQKEMIVSAAKELTNFKKDPIARRTTVHFQRRIDNLDGFREDFLENHRTIVRSKTPRTHAYFTEETLETFENTYLDSYANIQQAIKDLEDISHSSRRASHETDRTEHGPLLPRFKCNLPNLDIPQFSGNQDEWNTFHDTFESIIHQNAALLPMQKFQYLKGKVTGHAELILRKFDLVAEQYEGAWAALVEHYSDKREVFKHHMDAFASQPIIKSENVTEITQLLYLSQSSITAIEKLKINIADGEIFTFFALKKLPKETLEFCEREFSNLQDIPSWENLSSTLKLRIKTLRAINSTPDVPASETTKKATSSSNASSSNKSKRVNPKVLHASAKSDDKKPSYKLSCQFCSKPHILRRCFKFLNLPVTERKSIVDKHKLCVNCLAFDHLQPECQSQRTCTNCSERHHSLLHDNNSKPSNSSASAATSTTASAISTNSAALDRSSPAINTATTHLNAGLLPTLIVYARATDGRQLPLRALLDSGAQVTAITEAACQRLQLPRTPHRTSLCLMGGDSIATSQGYTSLTLFSSYEPDFHCSVAALILPKVTEKIPDVNLSDTNWSHTQALNLADPNFGKRGNIDIILGVNVLDDIMRLGIRRGQPGEPIAQLTAFGWVLSGKLNPHDASTVTYAGLHSTIKLEQLAHKFFDAETVQEEQTLSSEDDWTEQFFQSTHQRTEQTDGIRSFLVRLPLKTQFDASKTLGHSYRQARTRFLQLERKFAQNKDFFEAYSACINGYLETNQMQLVSTKEDYHKLSAESYKCSYLPHHAVVKAGQSVKDLRVVFDASAKTSNGNSLNDVLTTGPALQNDLSSVIMNWRLRFVVFSADIQKMYRRIQMNPDDAEYQRILWRTEPEADLQTYKLTTVTFGTASAPYTAIRVMHQLATDEGERFPRAAVSVRCQMYVDDILDGADDIETAVQLQTELVEMLRTGSFHLRKWTSNRDEVLEHIPIEHRAPQSTQFLGDEEMVKALGMYWQRSDDIFCFQINFNIPSVNNTKRTALSIVARLFDPLGWLNPFILRGKIFIKELWRRGLGWDDLLPDDLSANWNQFCSEFKDIGRIRIPRWLHTTSKITSYEIHTFCDGSMQAYAACCYLRIVDESGTLHSNLLFAKSRVCSLKTDTVPRIELCGAALAIKVYAYVRRHLQIPSESTTYHFWTDSMIVLSWLQGKENKSVYVQNRVNKVLRQSTSDQWHHVSTHDNPADLSTRGTSPQILATHEQWWHGPSWLRQPLEIPTTKIKLTAKEELASAVETRKQHQVTVLSSTVDEDHILNRYSVLNKLVRITALCLRFIDTCKSKKLPKPRQLATAKQVPHISVTEQQDSLRRIIQVVQEECYSTEINALRSKKPLPRSSHLLALNPFYDNTDQLLRVGGRLQCSLLPFDEMHPTILPSKHTVTQLLISDAHFDVSHGGPRSTMAHLRRKYWIIHAGLTIRRQLGSCLDCKRENPTSMTQQMGNLPAERVRPARAFTATGVDYAGPIDVRMSKGRGNKCYKGYIAVFVCLSTKAIHLEIVSDLTSAAFLAALDRFISRRGKPSTMHSDCGTTFIGADNELKRNSDRAVKIIQTEIVPHLIRQEIEWHFIPPYSPNFGGLWEAAVRSAKSRLHKVVKNSTLTYEEMSTVLCKIEACLNSRPLYAVSADPNDLNALTPGHFIIGDALLAAPEKPIEDLRLTDRWQYVQSLSQHFWQRWKEEYLHNLQHRTKWKSAQPNLNVNDLVIIRDERLPPQQWLLARVVSLHPGKDSLVRVVTLKTKNGLIKRSITKICRLPLEGNDKKSQADQAST